MSKLTRIGLIAGLVLILLAPVSHIFLFLGFMLISLTLSLGSLRLFHPHTHITGRIEPRTRTDRDAPTHSQTQGEPPAEKQKNSSKNADFFEKKG